MFRISTLSLGIVIALAAFGCQGSEPLSPDNSESYLSPAPTQAVASANLNCSYTPSGETSVAVGTFIQFYPSNVSDCDGAYGVIESSPGRLGFSQFPGCSVTQTQEASASFFKVRRCLAGPGALRIYTNSSKTTLLQIIGLDRIP